MCMKFNVNYCKSVYGLDGPGLEDGGGGVRFSARVNTSPGGPPSPLSSGYRVCPGGIAAGAWH
jgi:hypothetical protein